MITFEVAERILGFFPSSLTSTEIAAEPLLLVFTEEHSEHLAGSAIVVLACLVLSHVACQDLGRYAVWEDR